MVERHDNHQGRRERRGHVASGVVPREKGLPPRAAESVSFRGTAGERREGARWDSGGEEVASFKLSTMVEASGKKEEEQIWCLGCRAVGFRGRREGTMKVGNGDRELQALNNGGGNLESTRDEGLQERPRSGAPWDCEGGERGSTVALRGRRDGEHGGTAGGRRGGEHSGRGGGKLKALNNGVGFWDEGEKEMSPREAT